MILFGYSPMYISPACLIITHLCKRVVLLSSAHIAYRFKVASAGYYCHTLSRALTLTFLSGYMCTRSLHILTSSTAGTLFEAPSCLYLYCNACPNQFTPSVCDSPLFGKAPKSNALTVCSAGSALVIGTSTATEVVCEVGELKGAITGQKQ